MAEREPQALQIQAGTDDSWVVTLAAQDDGTLEPYTLSDVPACSITRGPGLPAVLAPTVAWLDPSAFTLTLSITQAQSGPIDPGTYPIDLYVTRAADGKRRRVWAGWIEIEPAADPAGALPPTYCTSQHLLDLAGDWLPALRQERTGANWLRARARARQWIDRAILAHVPPAAGQAGDLSYGLNLFGGAEAYSAAVRAYLDGDLLIRTPALVELVAHKALGFVCNDQLGTSSGEPDPWPIRASYYHREAARLAVGYIAEIDTNGDGMADFAFSLGSFKLRRD